jgi:hypothetical protein
MRQRINDKIYDTDSANLIGRWENDLPHSSPAWCTETLYQKKTGEYFLHGKGGKRSNYRGVSDTQYFVNNKMQHMSYASEKIIPLTYKAARAWAKSNMSEEEYEAVFGEVAENYSTVRLTAHIRTNLAEKVKRIAYKNGLSLSAYVENILFEYLQEEE